MSGQQWHPGSLAPDLGWASRHTSPRSMAILKNQLCILLRLLDEIHATVCNQFTSACPLTLGTAQSTGIHRPGLHTRGIPARAPGNGRTGTCSQTSRMAGRIGHTCPPFYILQAQVTPSCRTQGCGPQIALRLGMPRDTGGSPPATGQRPCSPAPAGEQWPAHSGCRLCNMLTRAGPSNPGSPLAAVQLRGSPQNAGLALPQRRRSARSCTRTGCGNPATRAWGRGLRASHGRAAVTSAAQFARDECGGTPEMTTENARMSQT